MKSAFTQNKFLVLQIYYYNYYYYYYYYYYDHHLRGRHIRIAIIYTRYSTLSPVISLFLEQTMR